jgi:hypothetical protein
MKTVKIRLVAEEAQVSVHFEPTGAMYALPLGEWFDITLSGEGTGLVEVFHSSSAIVIGAWPDAETSVLSRTGAQLPV